MIENIISLVLSFFSLGLSIATWCNFLAAKRLRKMELRKPELSPHFEWKTRGDEKLSDVYKCKKCGAVKYLYLNHSHVCEDLYQILWIDFDLGHTRGCHGFTNLSVFYEVLLKEKEQSALVRYWMSSQKLKIKEERMPVLKNFEPLEFAKSWCESHFKALRCG